MIGYTKARSEGFTAKKNDKLVATPPRKMKNNGYYNLIMSIRIIYIRSKAKR